MTLSKFVLPLVWALGFAAAPAWGADDDDPAGQPESAGDEQRDMQNGDVGAAPGVQAEDVALPQEKTKHIIKTLQRKTFLKIGRYEASPHIGFVTNDPFINRYLLGASFTYHPTEIFAIEAVGSFSPDFKKRDWKPITHQLVDENKVSPDISKIEWYGNINFEFSPIYGKVAVSGRKIVNFDLFGSFGTGIASTKDDLDALQACDETGGACDPDAVATEVQYHPTTNFGGGVRVILSEGFAVRLEGRSMTYIETISSTTLEMKNNFMLLASASFFFPGMD